MATSATVDKLNEFVDWFIPANLVNDIDMRKQARIFLYSHLFGPFLGNTVPFALYCFDPKPGLQIAVLAAAITGFWIFPFLLRAFGHYYLLATISVENLIFCILWSCYFYGGVTSPTLPWVLTIPLLALFYVGSSPRMRLVVLALFAVNLAGFLYLYTVVGHPVSSMPVGAMQSLGMVSTVATSLYVAMMALFYANALAAQVELGVEMREHMAKATELRIAVKEAERAGAAKSDFLAKFSHELRTPLNAVIGYSEMLLEDMNPASQAEAIADVRKIHAAGHFLLKLVNEILDLSKIEAGKMEVNLEPVDLQALVERVGERHRPLARENGLDLMVSCDLRLGTTKTDPAKLEGALGQLIDNAIKFTREGRITLTAARAAGQNGEEAVISVRDTGIGIAPERFGAIFEQFDLSADTSASKYGGTGLGLALSKKVSMLLGGDLSFESKLNAGSCFSINIPLVAVDASAGAENQDVAEALSEAEAFHRRLRPLVEETRRQESLPSSGAANVRVAANG
jgi:signal transduction histidine kinase